MEPGQPPPDQLQAALARAETAESSLEAAKVLLLRVQQELITAVARAEEAERHRELARSALLSSLNSGAHEELARAQAALKQMEKQRDQLLEQNKAAREKVASLAGEVQKFRASYLSGELKNPALGDRLNAAEERLQGMVKTLPADDQKMVREQSVSWMALQDSLTKLANGNKLDMQLEEAVTRARREESLVVLLLLDLDDFHGVNDLAGWKAGNSLLIEIGQKLLKLSEGSAFVARRAEDEYAFLVAIGKPEGGPAASFEAPLVRMRQVADMVLELFQRPFELAGQRIQISATLGLSVYPNDADCGQELLENAHSALHAAKRSKRGSYLFFNDQLYRDREDRVGQGTELARAIEEERLLFLYRPVASVARGTVAATQVEAYWQHPSHGRVAQADFLPIAEGLGLAAKLSDQVLRAALMHSRKVKGSIPTQIKLPSSTVGRAGGVQRILDQISRSHTRPESLLVDLPADCFTRWPGETTSFLEELSKWRVGRSISEVGSGPVPLAELCAARLDSIGLAESLTGQTPHIANQALLVKNLLALFKGMGLATRASGVNDKAQAMFLARHGCDFQAGDFLSPASSLDDFLARKRQTWTFG